VEIAAPPRLESREAGGGADRSPRRSCSGPPHRCWGGGGGGGGGRVRFPGCLGPRSGRPHCCAERRLVCRCAGLDLRPAHGDDSSLDSSSFKRWNTCASHPAEFGLKIGQAGTKAQLIRESHAKRAVSGPQERSVSDTFPPASNRVPFQAAAAASGSAYRGAPAGELRRASKSHERMRTPTTNPNQGYSRPESIQPC